MPERPSAAKDKHRAREWLRPIAKELSAKNCRVRKALSAGNTERCVNSDRVVGQHSGGGPEQLIAEERQKRVIARARQR